MAAPIAGILLQKYSQKTLLGVFIFFNAVFCAAMAFSQDFVQLCVSRCLVGMTQGPLAIYAAVWVEEFAPVQSKTMKHHCSSVGDLPSSSIENSATATIRRFISSWNDEALK